MMRVNDVLETHCTWNIKPDGDNIHRHERRGESEQRRSANETAEYIFHFDFGGWQLVEKRGRGYGTEEATAFCFDRPQGLINPPRRVDAKLRTAGNY